MSDNRGNQLLGQIAIRHREMHPIDWLKNAIVEYDGNLSALQRFLSAVDYSASMATIHSVLDRAGLKPWLAEHFPDRERGGQPTHYVGRDVKLVQRALEKGDVLSPRVTEVLRRRFVDGHTLAAIGADLGVSRQYIRQLQSKGLRAVRSGLTKAA